MAAPTSVISDVGHVLHDRDPRALNRRLIPDEAALDAVLAEAYTREWHGQHDLGRPFAHLADASVLLYGTTNFSTEGSMLVYGRKTVPFDRSRASSRVASGWSGATPPSPASCAATGP